MIEQAFSRIAVVLQVPFEAGLLEFYRRVGIDHAAPRRVGSGQHFLMVRFRPPTERGQQILADAPHIELIHLAAAARRKQQRQPIVRQFHVGPAVEIKILRFGFDPRFVPAGCFE